MKCSGFTRVEACAVLATTGLAAMFLLPALAQGMNAMQARENERRAQCQSNLKQVALGFHQYIQDYDERMPPASISRKPFGWAEAVQPYVRPLAIFQCPVERNAGSTDPKRPGYTDYWFNRNVAGAALSQVKAHSATLLAGDGDGGSPASNARYSLNALPQGWLQTPGSPALRHLGGANYAFVDGHVKWLTSEEFAQLFCAGIP